MIYGMEKKKLSEIKNLKSIDSKQKLKNFHEIFKLFFFEKGMKERKDLALINENFHITTDVIY